MSNKFIFIFVVSFILVSVGRAEEVTRSHALSEFSVPRHSYRDFSWSYVNPEAPKGGKIKISAIGSFDNLNPIILLGTTPTGLGLISDTLMVKSGEELDVAYGLLAMSVEYPEDMSWIVFHLHPDARYHDNHPITAQDFVFAWNNIQEYGNPFLKSFLGDVKDVTVQTPTQLKVTFKTRHNKKPLINFATTMSPQPQHWWTTNDRDISKTTLEPILGSGPYRMTDDVDPGRAITYQRVPDYWGREESVNVGRYNFDTIRVDYYRDADIHFESFKAGSYDLRQEYRAQWWAEGYKGVRALEEGQLIKIEISHQTPLGAQGFYFNTRRTKFSDPLVREAFGYLLDFEWIQKHIFYGQYRRVNTNFPNSEFGIGDVGLPGSGELEVMARLQEQFQGQIPERTFTHVYQPPRTDGSGNIRHNLRQALRLFEQAGWKTQNGRLTHTRTGEVMKVEFLEQTKSGMIRVLAPYVKTLKRVGIDASIRAVEHLEYDRRTDAFDFDVVSVFFSFPAPPGPSLRSYFGSESADIQGAANYAGIKEPVIDTLIEEILSSQSLDEIKVLTRVLDRVLLWNFYMVPHWYSPHIRLAYWDKFGQPEKTAPYNPSFIDTWWFDPKKALNSLDVTMVDADKGNGGSGNGGNGDNGNGDNGNGGNGDNGGGRGSIDGYVLLLLGWLLGFRLLRSRVRPLKTLFLHKSLSKLRTQSQNLNTG